MPTSADIKDKRGYLPIHRAFEKRSWVEIKRATDGGAELGVLTPSGANLEEFAEGLGLSNLFQQLKNYVSGKS